MLFVGLGLGTEMETSRSAYADQYSLRPLQPVSLLPSELQPTRASPGDLPRPLGRSSPGSFGDTALCWVPVHMRPCVRPLGMESLYPSTLLGSHTQAPLAFKAKCSGGSSSRCQSLTLCWRAIFMWEHPCVVSVCLIFFGLRAVFSMDVCHLFPSVCWPLSP